MEGISPGRVPYAQEDCSAAVLGRPVVGTDTSGGVHIGSI